MKQRLVVTKEEYQQMKDLIDILNTKSNSIPRRKFAKIRYKSLIRYIKNRPTNRAESTIILNVNKKDL